MLEEIYCRYTAQNIGRSGRYRRDNTIGWTICSGLAENNQELGFLWFTVHKHVTYTSSDSEYHL
jgi:hypothetical protein